jgi:hypothetical protein
VFCQVWPSLSVRSSDLQISVGWMRGGMMDAFLLDRLVPVPGSPTRYPVAYHGVTWRENGHNKIRFDSFDSIDSFIQRGSQKEE